MDQKNFQSFLVSSKIRKAKCTELQSSYFIGQRLSPSESYKLEFKEYDWPFVSNGNDNLQFTLMKTICSFLNRSGGTILIGVNDQKVVKGVKIKSIDEVKRYFDQLKKKYYPLPQGLIKTVEIPLKISEQQDMDEYKWVPDTYIIRIEVAQGELDRLYTFEHKNATFSSYREDASIYTLDKNEDIQQEIYQKAVRPQNKAQPIIYDEPDFEGLSESQQKVEPKNHKSKQNFISFSNILRPNIQEFIEFIQQKLEEKNMRGFSVIEVSQFMILIVGERINLISKALVDIIQQNEATISKFTFQKNPLQYGYLKSQITLKPTNGQQKQELIDVINELEFDFKIKEKGDIIVYAQKNMDDIPAFYSYCKENNYKIFISYE